MPQRPHKNFLLDAFGPYRGLLLRIQGGGMGKVLGGFGIAVHADHEGFVDRAFQRI